MGQQPSKEERRLQEVRVLVSEAQSRLLAIKDPAMHAAAAERFKHLILEENALWNCLSEYFPAQPAWGG